MKGSVLLFLTVICITNAKLYAQTIDSVQQINEIEITSFKTMNGIGHINDYKEQIIYAGKKTEVLLIDSLEANKAINNTRDRKSVV